MTPVPRSIVGLQHDLMFFSSWGRGPIQSGCYSPTCWENTIQEIPLIEKQQEHPVSVTVLLPAYNEEQAITETVLRIRELYPDFEVLIIDDGSTDNTMKVAMEVGANVWPYPYNIGNGAAVKTGLRMARGEWIVMMDADGQHDPADIARLLEHKDAYDMIVGARSKGSATVLHRDFANWFYNRLASYVTKFCVEYLTSGFRVVRAPVVREFIYLLPNTFSYPTTFTMGFLRSGRSVKYVPIRTAARKGKSKIKGAPR